MGVELFVAAIIAPAIFWAGYFYYKDRFKPEPLVKFGTSYLMGLAAAFLCLKFFELLSILGGPGDPSALMMSDLSVEYFFYCLAVTGPIEEFFKFLPFILFIVRFREFDEKIDGIIYGAAVALGFASYENILYLSEMEGFVLFGRAFASPLTHTIFASIWGYSVAKAHMEKKKILWPAIRGLFLAAACHGLFNFLTTSSTLRIFSALLILIIWIWAIIKMGRGRTTATSLNS